MIKLPFRVVKRESGIVFLDKLTTHKIKRSVAAFLLFFMMLPCYGLSGNYKNNLLALDLKKIGNNTLNLTIYSSKRFSLEPTSTKKKNGEYLIILPETFHSITSRPDFSKTNGLVKSVDIKLLPYNDTKTNNGYTKIILKTNSDNLKINIENEIISQNTDTELLQLIALKQKHSASSQNSTALKAESPQKTSKVITNNTNASVNNQSSFQTSTEKPSTSVDRIDAKIPKQLEQKQANPISFQQQAIQHHSDLKTVSVNNLPENRTIQFKTSLFNNKKIFYIIGIGCILFLLILLLFFLKILSFISKKKQNEAQTFERLHSMKDEKNPLNEDPIIDEELSVEEEILINQTNDETDEQISFEDSLKNEETTQEEDSAFNTLLNSAGGIIDNDYEPIFNEEENDECFDDLINEVIISDEDISDEKEIEQDYLINDNQSYEEYSQDNDFLDIFEEKTQDSETSMAEESLLFNEFEIQANEQEPTVLGQKELAEDKNLYLVELNGDYSLVGMIHEQASVLYKFTEKPSDMAIRSKLNETRGSEQIYIVQVGKWRALLGVNNDMRYILTL